MNAFYSPRFKRNLAGFSPSVQKKFKKQVAFLLQDLHYPSLRAKKYNEGEDIWQARVDGNARFYFRVEGDMYVLLDISKHPK